MSRYIEMLESVTLKYDHLIKKETADFCRYFDLVHFWYTRVNNEGWFSTVCDNPQWSLYFAEQGWYSLWPLLQNPRVSPHGVSILNETNCPLENPVFAILKNGREKFKMNIWVSIVNKQKNVYEEFGFSTISSNISFFVNEFQLFRIFFMKFKENNRFILEKLEENQINLSEVGGTCAIAQPSNRHRIENRQTLLSKLGLLLNKPISKRESEVTRLLLKGYSADQIGKKIYLSKRTVEHHIERIKDKLGCNSKVELIQKAIELESVGSLDDQKLMEVDL